MGILDALNANQYKTELENLKVRYQENQTELASLKLRYNDRQNELTELKQKNQNQQTELNDLKVKYQLLQNEANDLRNAVSSRQAEIKKLDRDIQQKRQEIIWLDEEILVQEFGIYKPKYDFASALDYKEALAEIRQTQKNLIKSNQAVTGSNQWTVNGNLAKGKKVVSDTQKLLLRAFNLECDDLVAKVRYTNFDASLERIYKTAESITKLASIMEISITQNYLSAKVKELRLAFEYQLKKQQEAEEQKIARAEQREQARLERELEAQRNKIEKEQTHYQTALEKVQAQLIQNPDNPDLRKKQQQLEEHLSDVDKALTDIDYRQANMKAGYVYIISNIGAFGENVYKIGMTRRLNPQDRIDELGDASVPFNFDVHAMIFSEDAPALEAALHRAFENRKLNMVNQRREFFYVTLDEIKDTVRKNFDKTVEFIDVPNAEQYRVSEKMRGRTSPIPQRHQVSNLTRTTTNISSTSHTQSKENQPSSTRNSIHATASSNLNNQSPSSKSQSVNPTNLLHTKWGTYERPVPYTIQIKYGERSDAPKVM